MKFMKLKGILYRMPPALAILWMGTAIATAEPLAPPADIAGSDPLIAMRAAVADGLFDLAGRMLERYLKSPELASEDENQALLLLARVYHEQGRQAAILERIPQPDPESGDLWAAEFLFWRALAHHHLGRNAEALKITAAIMRHIPGSGHMPEVLRLRAAVLAALDDLPAALEMHAMLAKDYPDSRQAASDRLAWARTLIISGQPDQAQEILTILTEDLSLPAGRQAACLLGRLAMESGDYETAVERLNALLSDSRISEPEAGLCGVLLAEALERSGDPASALQALESAMPRLAPGADRRQAGITAARLMFKTGQSEAAAARLREIIHAAPKSPDVPDLQLGMANGLLREGLYAPAADEFQVYLEAFTNRSGQAAAMSGLGWSLLGLDRTVEAAESFEQAAQLHADLERRLEVLFKAAEAWFASERFGAAHESYQRAAQQAVALNATGHVARARYMQAETLIRRREFEKAFTALRSLTMEFPEQPHAAEALLRIAKLHEQQGALPAALESYDIVLQNVSDSAILADGLLSSGMLHYQLFRFDDALKAFDELLQRFPDHEFTERARFMRVWSYSMTGREQAAMEAAADFIAHHPDSERVPEILFRIAEHDFNHERMTEAEEGFLSLAERYPQSAAADDALLWAGRAATRRKNFRAAIETFTRLANLYPDSPRLPEARFSQADAFSELGDFPEAILLFDEVITHFPASYLVPAAKGRKGDCQFMLGNIDQQRYLEALASYRALVEMPAAPPDLRLQALYKIGRCYEHLKDRDLALEYFYSAVVRYSEMRQRGIHPTPAAVWGFQRAAFDAAALLENDQKWRQAVRMLQRVVDADVPAAGQAAERIERLRAEHWLLYY